MYDGARADDCPVANPYAWTDECTCSDPALRFDDNGSCKYRERDFARIMRAGAQIRFLGDDGVIADFDVIDVVDYRVVADPTIITDDEFPRICYAHARPDQNVPSDSGAKESQGESPPCVKYLRRWTYEHGVEYPPKLDKPGGSPARPFWQLEQA